MDKKKKIISTLVIVASVIALSVLIGVFLPRITELGKENKKAWIWGTNLDDSTGRTTEPGVPKVFAEDGAYTWWTNALALRYVGERDKTYFSFVTGKGEMSVTSLDHKTGVYDNYILAEFERDDHNSAALGVLPDGRILAVYARHSKDRLIRWRISNPEDILYFDEEETIESAGSVTYIQLHRISENEYRIFYRYSMANWATRVYNWKKNTWTDEVVWLTEPNGGQYYLWTQEDREVGKINVFMTCHPTNGTDQAIRYGYFDSDGNIRTTGDIIIGNLGIQASKDKRLSPRDFDKVYEPEKGGTRLFDVSFMGEKVVVLFGEFTSPAFCDYKYAYYDSDIKAWIVEDITDSGRAAVAGNHYFGGVSFDKKDIQTVYVSKEKEGTWYIEKWITDDYGKTWNYTKLDESKGDVLLRPIVPYNSHDDIDVLYMKGKYPSYLNYDTDIVSYAD